MSDRLPDAYTLNNPLRYVDPSGHAYCPPGGGSQCLDENAPLPRPFVHFAGDWPTAHRLAVVGGVQAVANALLRVFHAERSRHPGTSSALTHAVAPQNMPIYANDAFRAVYGHVTFRHIQGNTINGWAEAHLDWVGNGCNRGEVCYDDSVFQVDAASFSIRQNVAHELGHGIDHRGGRQGRSDLLTEWGQNPDFPRRDPANIELRGYADLFFGWQQTKVRTHGEEFADMFLGWTYHQWGPRPAGETRSRWMRTNMPGWIALAVTGE